MKRICAHCGSESPAAMLRCKKCGRREFKTVDSTEKSHVGSSRPALPTAGFNDLSEMLSMAEALDADASVVDSSAVESDTLLDHQYNTIEFALVNTDRPDTRSVSSNSSNNHVSEQGSSIESSSSASVSKSGLHNAPSRSQSGVIIPERIKATCQKCDKQIETSHTLAGMKVSCPKCGESVQLPLLKSTQPTADSSYAELLQYEVNESLKLPPDILLNPVGSEELSAKEFKQLETTIQTGLKDQASFEALSVKSVKGLLSTFDKVKGSRNQELAKILLEKLPYVPEIFRTQALHAIAAAQLPEAYNLVIVHLKQDGEVPADDVLKMLTVLQDLRAVRPLIYAYACLKSLRPKIGVTIHSFEERSNRPLLSVIEENVDSKLRNCALHLLQKFQPVEGIATLTKVVKGTDVEERRLAARTLHRIQDSAVLPVLHQLLKDSDETIRIFASQGLILNPDPRNLKPLAEALLDSNEDVQVNAMNGLAAIQDPSVIPVLIGMLNHSSVDLKFATIDALGKLKSKEAAPQLLQMLEDYASKPEENRLVLKIVDALKRIRDPRSVLPLIDLLVTQDIRLKKAAIEALGVLKDPSARLPLEDVLERYWREEIKASAAKALGALGDSASIPVLQNALHGPDVVRTQALIALGTFKDSSTLAAIRGRLTDPLPQVRYQAVRLVGEMQDKESIALVEKLILDPDEMVQRAAVKSLSALGSERTEEQIRSSLKKEQRSHSFRKILSIPKSVCLGLAASLPGGVYAFVGGSTALVLLLCFIFLNVNGTSNGQPRATVSGYVGMVDLTEDGSWLVVARTRGMFEIWDTQKNTLLTLEDHLPTSKDVVIAKKLNTIILATGQGVVFAEISENGKIGQPSQPTKDEGFILELCASQDKAFAASSDNKGICRRWNISKKSSDFAIALNGAPSAISLNTDGRLLAVGGKEGKATIYDWETSEILFEHVIPVRRGQPKVGDVRSLAFSPDGELLAVSTERGVIQVLNIKSTKSLSLIDNAPFASVVVFSDAQTLWGYSNILWKLADIQSGKLEPITKDLGMLSSHAFCAGKMIFAGGHEEKKPVFVADMQSGKTSQLLDE